MSLETSEKPPFRARKAVQSIPEATILFAGDSGDGMQLTGSQFTLATAFAQNDLATLPDFPAEIRAPAGTTYGVSGFQLHFGSVNIRTPGDEVDLLVAMNPAALKVNLGRIRRGGAIMDNVNAFTPKDLKLADYDANPLEDASLKDYQVFEVELTKMTREALKDSSLDKQQIDRSKNMFALGLALWLYSRPMEPTIDWLSGKFARKPAILDANIHLLKKGYHFGETTEDFIVRYEVQPAQLKPGLYRAIRGAEAIAMGLVAASQRSGLPLFYGSYPITPASELLHELSRHKNFGVMTFQAEDEIAAVGAAIGASFGGNLGVCATSGPGLALKAEAIGLAMMMELPMVIINMQRGGPSTGLPTKTEQSDLLQAMYGRNGESPLPIIAASTPGLEHRLGGLEKENETGNISYEADNHELMTHLRAAKVKRVTQDIPPTVIHGDEAGEVLVTGWGSTKGAIETAVDRVRQRGLSVSSIHLRYLNPLPSDLGEIFSRFEHLLVPELNNGQLVRMLRDRFLLPFIPLNKIQGQPFKASEVEEVILSLVEKK